MRTMRLMVAGVGFAITLSATSGGCRAEGKDRVGKSRPEETAPVKRKDRNDQRPSNDREREGPLSRAKEQPATLPDLAREVGLSFPASARLIGVHREAGMDDAVMFKVEIATGDLPAFTKTCPVPAEAFAPGTRGLMGPDVGFWDPHRAANLRTGQAIMANHRTLNVGIADGSGGVVALYIVNHGT